MNCHISIGNWARQCAAARVVRDEVFIIEQAIPVELEWDGMDTHCLHAVAHDAQGQAIATGRLLPDGHIGRMAVCKAARGAGIGAMILQALMDQARARGDRAVLLNAQTHAEAFYARHGFVREGEEFMEAGIPHIQMRHVFPT
jgi:predicted GNAT family N-acyltransferase